MIVELGLGLEYSSMEGEDVRPFCSIISAKASTARWLVNIMPPYFFLHTLASLDPLSDVVVVVVSVLKAPDAKSSRTLARFSVWKRCSRTGMKEGV